MKVLKIICIGASFLIYKLVIDYFPIIFVFRFPAIEKRGRLGLGILGLGFNWPCGIYFPNKKMPKALSLKQKLAIVSV